MGLLKKVISQVVNDTGETEMQIREKLKHSDFTAEIASTIAQAFSFPGEDKGGEFYHYLIADTDNNCIWIRVYTNAVAIVKQHRALVRTGVIKTEPKYEEESSGIGFGASGIADLPNDKYRKVLQDILFSFFKDCLNPNYLVELAEYIGPLENPAINRGFLGCGCIKVTMKNSAKQSW